jgi:cytochrome c oxidase subunit IV
MTHGHGTGDSPEHASHDSADHAEHPTWSTYWKVALFLTIITAVEVYVYYTEFAKHALFVPALLIMSAVKFVTVVLYYMHLKYDHKLFKALFTGPLIIAMATLVALVVLFSGVTASLRGGS